MRKVIDRSYLQEPELRAILAASKKNRAVLPDYAAMEAFKGDAIANIASATQILRDFPKRVIVLKSTRFISMLKGRRCGYTRRMIDRDQTRGFPEWCFYLERALAGDKSLQRQILENGKEADAHLEHMRDEQLNYAENLAEHAKRFDEAELKAWRRGAKLSDDMFDEIMDHVLEMAAFLFATNPHLMELPHARELPYTFIFRYALAGYLVALRRLKDGLQKVNPEKVRNDIVDCAYVAQATYFQGFLTKDLKASELFSDTKALVNFYLAHPPPPDHVMRRIAG